MIDRTLRKIFNAEAPPPMIWEPQVHGRLYPDRPYFLTRVRHGISLIPPELQAAFKEGGCAVHIARRVKIVANEVEEYGEYHPSQAFSEAMYGQHCNFIVMPQANFYGTILQQVQSIGTNFSIRRTITHEIGHAFSQMEPFGVMKSQTNSFLEAYNNDLGNAGYRGTKLPRHIKNLYGLSNLDDPLVKEEVFAEIFSEIMANVNKESKYFPNTKAHIKHDIEKTCSEFRVSNPDFDPDTYPKMEVAVA